MLQELETNSWSGLAVQHRLFNANLVDDGILNTRRLGNVTAVYTSRLAVALPLLCAAVEANVPLSPPPARSSFQTNRPLVFRTVPCSENVASTRSPSMKPFN